MDNGSFVEARLTYSDDWPDSVIVLLDFLDPSGTVLSTVQAGTFENTGGFFYELLAVGAGQVALGAVSGQYDFNEYDGTSDLSARQIFQVFDDAGATSTRQSHTLYRVVSDSYGSTEVDLSAYQDGNGDIFFTTDYSVEYSRYDSSSGDTVNLIQQGSQQATFYSSGSSFSEIDGALFTLGASLTLTPADLATYTLIAVSPLDLGSTVSLALGAAGSVNLSAALGTRGARLTLSDGGNIVTLGAGGDSVVGGAGNDLVRSGAGNDTLVSAGGNDRLDGGDGNDFLTDRLGAVNAVGGGGDDVVDIAGVGGSAAGGEGEGNDALILRSGNLAPLALSGFETLLLHAQPVVASAAQLTAFAAIKALNPSGSINIRLNAPAVVDLTNGLQDRRISIELAAGANTVTTGAGNDTIRGSDGADVLVGGAGNDVLSGGGADDQLRGGSGADAMTGGSGADQYTVDDAGDTVVEADGGGTDLVLSATTFTLSAFVEKLTLTGTASIGGSGNTLANALFGNAASNILNGLDGNDSVFGEGGADQLFGGNGNDSLQGGDGADSLDGGQGDDTLDGGAGEDRLLGGFGNDTYLVDSPFDVVVEGPDGGADLVRSSASVIMSANVEDLALTGSGAIDGTGNSLANKMTGNAAGNILAGADGNDLQDGKAGNDWLIGGNGADRLVGDVSNDTLTGGAGRDNLKGGAGSDRFVLDPNGGSDTVSDFANGDLIAVEASAVGRPGQAGPIAPSMFVANAGAATTPGGQFVFDLDRRVLLWDADGTGAGAALELGKFSGTAVLSAADLMLI